MEPRIELPQELVDRLAAVRIVDGQVQYNYRQALRDDPNLTDDLFIERLTTDLETMEHNKAANDAELAKFEAEQAKQRKIDEAHQRQANRIAIAGMALPAIIATAAFSKSVNDIACAALTHADALLAAADDTKDPILND